MDEKLGRETEEIYYADPEKGENNKMGEVKNNMPHPFRRQNSKWQYESEYLTCLLSFYHSTVLSSKDYKYSE